MPTLISSKKFYIIFILTSVNLILSITIKSSFAWLFLIVIFLIFTWKEKNVYLTMILMPAMLFPVVPLVFKDFGFELIIPFLSDGLVDYAYAMKTYWIYFILIFIFYACFKIGTRTQVKGYNLSTNVMPFLFTVYAIGATAGLLVYIKVGGIPLLNISLRWSVDPKLVLLLMSHVVIMPALIACDTKKKYYKTYFVMFVFSIILLSGLGARNTIIKLFFSTFFTSMLCSLEIGKKLFRLAFFPIAVLFFGVGFLSKSSIYGVDDFIFLPFLFLYLDIAGTFYNFDSIIRNSDFFLGYFQDFRMFTGTILSLIPGVEAYYSNFHVTEIVNGDMFVRRLIDGESLFFPMSLSPTLFGVGYGSFGIVGSVLEISILGWFVGYNYKLSIVNPNFAFLGGVLGMIIFYGGYAGYVTPDNVYFLLLCIFVKFIMRAKFQ